MGKLLNNLKVFLLMYAYFILQNVIVLTLLNSWYSNYILVARYTEKL